MRYENLWVDSDNLRAIEDESWKEFITKNPNLVVKNEKRPSPYHGPLFARSRIHGHTYQPYEGNTPWCKAANAAMKLIAQSNFVKRK